MKKTEDFEYLTCSTYTFKGLKGEINIFHPEEDEYAEVDYDSGDIVGSGSIKDIYMAIKCAKIAIADYKKSYPAPVKFKLMADNRDGYGKARKRIFDRFLRGVKFDGFYYG